MDYAKLFSAIGLVAALVIAIPVWFFLTAFVGYYVDEGLGFGRHFGTFIWSILLFSPLWVILVYKLL